jgi:Tol biopolymer transport system component
MRHRVDTKVHRPILGRLALIFALAVAFVAMICATGLFMFTAMSNPNRASVYLSGGEYQANRFAVSPAGAAVVFASPLGRGSAICSVALDGTNRRNLTSGTAFDGNPSYTADGKCVVFDREVNGCSHIFIMTKDGTGAHQITYGNEDDALPIANPANNAVWFARTVNGNRHQHDAYQVNVATHKVSRVAPLEIGCYVSFARNGTVAFYPVAKSFSIGVEPPESTAFRTVISGSEPAISPDGKRIVFIDDRGNLSLCNVGGSSLSTLLIEHGDFLNWPIFEPDGHHVMFLMSHTSQRDGEICEIDLRGAEFRNIVSLK